jgi:hypothetical protein
MELSFLAGFALCCRFGNTDQNLQREYEELEGHKSSQKQVLMSFRGTF